MTIFTSTARKLKDLDWTFKGITSRQSIHSLHTYPAMMACPLAQKLIRYFSRNGETVLDPFCGSGVVTNEAIMQDRNVYGYDINPLALLISRVKSKPINKKFLMEAYRETIKSYHGLNAIETPSFKNVDYWFKPNVIEGLAKLKFAVRQISNSDIRDFFNVVFSRVVRETSNTKNSEFKLFRIKSHKLEYHHPDVLLAFEKRSLEAIHVMDRFEREYGNNMGKSDFILHDARNEFPLRGESIDLMLTSPPYGDSRTTVAYGQFSRLSLQWMDLWEKNLDVEALGGKKRSVKKLTPILTETIEKVSSIDSKNTI